MSSCPSTAIKYSSRKKAFKLYSEIKSYDMVSEIVDKDMKRLSIDLIGLNGSLRKYQKHYLWNLMMLIMRDIFNIMSMT